MADIKVGDRVSWATPQGRTRGKVIKRLTSRTKVGGTEIAATRDEPRFLVESEGTGAHAAHRPEAVRRLKSAS